MRLRTWIVSLLLTLPALAQTFTGTNVKPVDASRGMREAIAAAGTKWVAWTVPTSETSICCSGNRGGCSGCSLEGNGLMIGTVDGVSRRTTTMLIAARIERGHIDRIRLFDANCPVSANGTSIAVLNGVTPEASIRYLVQETRDSDDDELLPALSLHEHPNAVPALIDLVRHDPSTNVRRGAIFWLGQKAGDKAAGELRHAVDNDPNDDVREHAVFAISQLPRDRAVPMLIDLVKTHKRARVRERAIFWLAQTGDPRALDLIEQILTK
jgi:hypothetical protein